MRVRMELLIRKLQASAGVSLGHDEIESLCSLDVKLVTIKSQQDVVREHEAASFVTLVLEGFLCRYKIVADGKRQVLSFHIPGDIPDLQSLHFSISDHNLCSLAPSKLALISHATMEAFLDNHPRLAKLFWRDTLIDAAIFREWMTSIGRRASFTRVAHLACELIVRMRAVGLASDHAIKLPLKQTDIADALGITPVHANRTIQELRRQGLIQFNNGELIALHWERLKKAGEFDRTYLHMGDVAELKQA